jgi:hypothetical protein
MRFLFDSTRRVWGEERLSELIPRTKLESREAYGRVSI